MIQVTPHMRILVAVEPADFSKGIDGLARVCKEVLKQDPFRGWMFVFRNRRATAVKVLAYDGQGFWLCQKRLSRGHFRWWPSSRSEAAKTLEAHQLQVLLCGQSRWCSGGAGMVIGEPVGLRSFPPKKTGELNLPLAFHD